jgi:hypothetical protein
MKVKVTAIAAVAAAGALLAAMPAVAHEGGHKGGCEDFGQINYDIGKDPAAFGFPGARNLGDIVSGFTKLDDGQPGVGDIVEQIDHAACG